MKFFPDTLDLTNGDQVISFIVWLEHQGLQPVLIVIDTLARSMPGGDENSPRDMGVLVAAADRIRKRLDCTVLFIHHPIKSGNKREIERGHGSLRGAADTMLILRCDKSGLLLRCEKQKDGPPFSPIRLQLKVVDLGRGQSSCVMVAEGESEAEEAVPSLSLTHQFALAMLVYVRRWLSEA